MYELSDGQVLLVLLAMAVILVVGRGTAEIARRLGQPEVLGELIGGFLLGPSIFGALLPGAQQTLFGGEAVGVALSGFSWIGAILLLLIAGFEVDLGILRQELRPGALTAAFAIVPSLIAGSLFAWFVLGMAPPADIFLGIVLSVTAVSVAAKITIERGSLRRRYAQVTLASGVASEVLVWLLIAVVVSMKAGNPLLAGLRSAAFAIGFFAIMVTLGRRLTFWAMRRVADSARIAYGPLSLVLVLAFSSAAFTARLGLHPLLGAFTIGVVIGAAPRVTRSLQESVQSIAVGFFAPIFFVLAGMRVDIFQLGHIWTIGAMLLLFVVATAVKVGFGTLGARIGGLDWWEAGIVGVGVNLKGGTDVIVAILGVELGLLSGQGYAMYALVAILTVLVSPPALGFLEARVPTSGAERTRLEREESRRRAYLPTIERVAVPIVPALLPEAAASVVETIARAKGEEAEFFDITRLTISGAPAPNAAQSTEIALADDRLDEASEMAKVEVTERRVESSAVLAAILDASSEQTLLAIGARPPAPAPTVSLGHLQDQIIDRARGDVLVAIFERENELPPVDRIVVPITGFAYSLKAADVAGYLAKALRADLTLLTVVDPRQSGRFWREVDRHSLLATGRRVVREATFRLERLDVSVAQRVVLSEDPSEAIVRELARGGRQLGVSGALDRSVDGQLDLGPVAHAVLTRTRLPMVLLISHDSGAFASE
ncbi:MAG: cation:proton antiporter [Thermomicrobiales bacterium]|nr:cation:proton antiporter [Thermomicrobiales bacterium]